MTSARTRVAALVLAAGRSVRMGGQNKLLLDFHGTPMLTGWVDTLLASRARPVIVVTGYQAALIRDALGDRDVRFIHNADHAEGMGASIRSGVSALSPSLDGVLICLADLPELKRVHIDALMSSFEPAAQGSIGVPTYAGRRGHPVLFASRFFPELLQLSGDRGARDLLDRHAEQVYEVPVPDGAVWRDVDTVDQLQRASRIRADGSASDSPLADHPKDRFRRNRQGRH